MIKRPYITRTLEPVIRRAFREFPAVTLTGPRQSGKTTLLQHLFRDRCEFVSVDAPDVRAMAQSDPRGFLEVHPPPVIFDEIQQAPVLLPYIKEAIDKNRHRRGQFILTGSQNLMLAQGVTETLAGRTAMLRLLPLSCREMAGFPREPLPWARRASARKPEGGAKKLWAGFLRGGYPDLAANPARNPLTWHAGYVQTYLERDVRSVKQVGDLASFQAFLKAIATRSAQVLNLAEVSREIGVSFNTAKAWLSVLVATYQVLVVPPFFANLGKRLRKSPKIYMGDVGTLLYLVGLREPDHAMSGPMAGAIWETAVVVETYRAVTHLGLEPPLYHWRTAGGAEVDLVVDTGKSLVPIEVKASSTANLRMATGIEAFRKDFGPRAERGLIVYSGAQRLPVGKDAWTCPFGEY